MDNYQAYWLARNKQPEPPKPKQPEKPAGSIQI
jgi:hypothetical protein